MRIIWRRVQETDFPLLQSWLRQPHVARWWNHETSMAAITRDFGPGTRRAEPGEDLLASLDGEPFGLLQRAYLDDYPEERDVLAAYTDVPPRAATIDYLIGDPGNTGRGIGPALIRSAVQGIWASWADAPCVITSVVAGNRPSWRALEKAGFGRAAEGDLEPDNPIDPPLHYIYRLDRPADLH